MEGDHGGGNVGKEWGHHDGDVVTYWVASWWGRGHGWRSSWWGQGDILSGTMVGSPAWGRGDPLGATMLGPDLGSPWCEHGGWTGHHHHGAVKTYRVPPP